MCTERVERPRRFGVVTGSC